MDAARSLIRRGLRRVGLQKIHHPSFPDFIRHENIRTVFDVGANGGHYGVELREGGFDGRIVSFEPVAASFAKLDARARRDDRWNSFRLGLGAVAEERTISVTASDVFSSFKPPSNYTANKFVGAREVSREVVDVIRLDQFIANHPAILAGDGRAYLKIDTQGFEREVIEGAGRALDRFFAIQLELPLRQLYQGQDSWLTMVDWLDQLGFEVAMAKENGFDWQAVRLLELDVVFVRKA